MLLVISSLIITIPAPRLGIPCLGRHHSARESWPGGGPLSQSSAPHPGAPETHIASTHRRVCLFLPISLGRKLSQEKDKEKRKEGGGLCGARATTSHT